MPSSRTGRHNQGVAASDTTAAGPTGLAHVATVSFLAARAAPSAQFWLALAGGIGLARAAAREGVRVGYGVSVAAMLQTVAVMGPARIHAPLPQALRAPMLGALHRRGAGIAAQIAACFAIRLVHYTVITAALVWIVLGGLDAYTGSYDALTGWLGVLPEGQRGALIVTAVVNVGLAVFYSVTQVLVYRWALGSWPAAGGQVSAPIPDPGVDRGSARFDPRAITLAAAFAFGLLLSGTTWPLLASVAAWLPPPRGGSRPPPGAPPPRGPRAPAPPGGAPAPPPRARARAGAGGRRPDRHAAGRPGVGGGVAARDPGGAAGARRDLAARRGGPGRAARDVPARAVADAVGAAGARGEPDPRRARLRWAPDRLGPHPGRRARAGREAAAARGGGGARLGGGRGGGLPRGRGGGARPAVRRAARRRAGRARGRAGPDPARSGVAGDPSSLAVAATDAAACRGHAGAPASRRPGRRGRARARRRRGDRRERRRRRRSPARDGTAAPRRRRPAAARRARRPWAVSAPAGRAARRDALQRRGAAGVRRARAARRPRGGRHPVQGQHRLPRGAASARAHASARRGRRGPRDHGPGGRRDPQPAVGAPRRGPGCGGDAGAGGCGGARRCA